MAFFAGNKKTLYFGTQSGKGTPQTTPTLAMRVTDFTPNEVRAKIQLAETDASAQEAGNVVVGVTPGATFSAYMRPSEFDFWAAALLGNNVDSGSNPNYIHTADADETQPYLTMYEVEPSLLCNQHTDIRVTSLTARGGAGQALEVSITIEALGFAAGATAPTSPAPVSEQPFVYPEVSITKGASTPGTFDSFEITINRNATRLQGDNGMTSLDIIPGKFAVNGTATKYVADDDDQRSVDTGSSSGTAPTTTIFTEALSILVARTANLRVTFDMDAVEWTTREAGVRTDGTPLMEVLGFRTVPQATLAGNLQIITRNAKATPDT